MTLLVEDGSLVTGAVVYVSEADLADYALVRGVTITGNPSELLMGTINYIETLNFTGEQLSPPRKVEWPRIGAKIDRRAIPTNEIPQILKDLQCEIALYHDKNGDPYINIQRLAIREKVGDIEQSFSEKAPLVTDYPRSIKMMANKLIGISNGGMSFMVSRG